MNFFTKGVRLHHRKSKLSLPLALSHPEPVIRLPIFRSAPALIGVVHLPPLPGSPGSTGSITTAQKVLRRELLSLKKGGAHGVILENFGDAPFHPGPVPPGTLASMTALAVEARRIFPGPLGINVLRNDGIGALAVAHAAGADFIRVNVLVGARVADQGVLQGIADRLLRMRREIGAGKIRILADVDVKHSAPLAPGYSLEDEARDAWERGGADGLILSGAGTGHGTDPDHLCRARASVPNAPLWVGSGATLQSLSDFLPQASGFIVGTALKRGGRIDPDRVRAFTRALARSSR